eukprot:gene13335-9168_t
MGLEIFEIDPTTPHPGVALDGSSAQRDTNGGWVTLRTKEPLTAQNHQWAVKIVDQGEGVDGSGLMLGLLPHLSSQMVRSMGSKYIMELGGWCISRAGDRYGDWECDELSFSTGCVVEFDLDASSGKLYIVCGKYSVCGRIESLTDADVVYPAVSLYYLNQRVTFV